MILTVALAVNATAQIPFGGAIQGYERGAVQNASLQSTFGTVAGVVSNLGQISFTYNGTIDLTTRTGTGLAVLLVGKDGDSIFAKFSGAFHLPTAGSPLSVPSVTENYTITGGTGRFKGANGKFVVERLVNFVDSAMDFDFTAGVIVNGTVNCAKADNAP